MTIIRLNPSGASSHTLQRRILYGGKKGRAALRRLRRERVFLTKLAHSLASDFGTELGFNATGARTFGVMLDASPQFGTEAMIREARCARGQR
jgi:hypothetical protein